MLISKSVNNSSKVSLVVLQCACIFLEDRSKLNLKREDELIVLEIYR